MHKSIVPIFLIFIFIIWTPLISKSQSPQDYIFGKKWYAVKAFYGQPGEEKINNFICEESCSLEGQPYLFYFDVDYMSGAINTDKSFNLRVPRYWHINLTGNKLIMYFTNLNSDNMQFDILYASDDFLQIQGPDKEIYFLISNNKRR